MAYNKSNMKDNSRKTNWSKWTKLSEKAKKKYDIEKTKWNNYVVQNTKKWKLMWEYEGRTSAKKAIKKKMNKSDSNKNKGSSKKKS